ncbi:hypothetical protein WMY93_014308 [Mugilogobius chulae]|uniref:RING-type domain-containing protein n=1 Tax=Mugilogobius chulae TaxID=88201 RepID=A0AAW0NUZ0_9GOBI
MGTAQSRTRHPTRWHIQEAQNEVVEKKYDPNDDTMTFVEGEDEMDFLCHGYTSLRARMSCGHTVTPMSLTDWCLNQLKEGATSFICGNCAAKWSYKEVRKMALLTQEEAKYYEDKLFSNKVKGNPNFKLCPGCKCRVEREDTNNLCVTCPKCTASKNKAYRFCWQCLKEWKGPVPVSDHCENEDCCNQKICVLRNCPVVNFKDVQGVNDCPSIRACPSCGELLEHSGIKCKFLVCKKCKAKFCFVCLKLFPECQNYFELCLCGIAPRQTSIPEWDGKIANNAKVEE